MDPLEKVVRTPEHQFIRYMMNKFHLLPDDVFYERINPYLKVWLYESWLHDRELEGERFRNHAILTGSFFNPEGARKMIKDENPDFASTDIEETTKLVRDTIIQEIKEKEGNNKRKKRRVVD